MTQTVGTNLEAVTGFKKFFLSFSLLLGWVQQIAGILLLKMKKSKKSTQIFI
jgi:hypothetical protein